ncbi:MAG: rhodanese-like domain-containing protein [Elusimicrobiota bacterium]|nr:rhodanese-like domain-containing protein [Elusimicrobiota bacterium]
MRTLLIILTLILAGCGPRTAKIDVADNKTAEVNHLSPREVRERQMKGSDFMLVDVRSKREYGASHITGAVSVPYEELEYRNLNPGKEIIVYCGARGCPLSKRAAAVLIKKGYSNVKILKHGIEGWLGENYPITAEKQEKMEAVNILSPAEVRAMLSGNNDVSIIDVRSPDEYRSGHIKEAENIPVGRISESFKDNRNLKQKIVLYCRTESRSKAVAKKLIVMGYENIFVLFGGISFWVQEGYGVTVK